MSLATSQQKHFYFIPLTLTAVFTKTTAGINVAQLECRCLHHYVFFFASSDTVVQLQLQTCYFNEKKMCKCYVCGDRCLVNIFVPSKVVCKSLESVSYPFRNCASSWSLSWTWSQVCFNDGGGYWFIPSETNTGQKHSCLFFNNNKKNCFP